MKKVILISFILLVAAGCNQTLSTPLPAISTKSSTSNTNNNPAEQKDVQQAPAQSDVSGTIPNVPFIRDGDLWLYNSVSKIETRLTEHEDLNFKSTQNKYDPTTFTVDNNSRFYQVPRLSPDGTQIAAFCFSDQIISEIKGLQKVQPQINFNNYTTSAEYSLCIINAGTKKQIKIKLSNFYEDTQDYLQFSSDGRSLVIGKILGTPQLRDKQFFRLDGSGQWQNVSSNQAVFFGTDNKTLDGKYFWLFVTIFNPTRTETHVQGSGVDFNLADYLPTFSGAEIDQAYWLDNNNLIFDQDYLVKGATKRSYDIWIFNPITKKATKLVSNGILNVDGNSYPF